MQVVYESDHLVVVNKPAGLLSVPGRGAETDPQKADCVRARVLHMYPQATGPMTIHRLDQDTSGLIAVALNALTQRNLSMQFEARTVKKAYIALLDGHHDHLEEGDKGVVEAPIIIDWPNRPKKKHDPVEGKPSTTRYRVLSREEFVDEFGTFPVTRIRFEPITGRGHQLRVHAAWDRAISCLGAAIVGDSLYHPDGPKARGGRLMLHAAELAFHEPEAEEWIELRSFPDF